MVGLFGVRKVQPDVFDFEALYRGFWSSVCVGGGMGLGRSEGVAMARGVGLACVQEGWLCGD